MLLLGQSKRKTRLLIARGRTLPQRNALRPAEGPGHCSALGSTSSWLGCAGRRTSCDASRQTTPFTALGLPDLPVPTPPSVLALLPAPGALLASAVVAARRKRMALGLRRVFMLRG